MTREFIRMTSSLRGRAKSSRPRRQGKNARRRGFRHVENVFGRQRSHRALQPAAIERVIGIHSFMRNKPNFRKAKMKLNFYSTKGYENKPPLPTPPKQTQSNPTCSELVEPIPPPPFLPQQPHPPPKNRPKTPILT